MRALAATCLYESVTPDTLTPKAGQLLPQRKKNLQVNVILPLLWRSLQNKKSLCARQ
jgi:hypothetical protein